MAHLDAESEENESVAAYISELRRVQVANDCFCFLLVQIGVFHFCCLLLRLGRVTTTTFLRAAFE